MLFRFELNHKFIEVLRCQVLVTMCIKVPECLLGLPGGPHLAMGVTGMKESDESILGLV
jgi:hypothetical protein